MISADAQLIQHNDGRTKVMTLNPGKHGVVVQNLKKLHWRRQLVADSQCRLVAFPEQAARVSTRTYLVAPLVAKVSTTREILVKVAWTISGETCRLCVGSCWLR